MTTQWADTGEGRYTIGDQFGYIQNAEHIHNHFGPDSRKYFDAGLAALHDKLYGEAVRCLTEFLTSGRSDHGPTTAFRQQAHAFLALALLRGSPPSYRHPGEIDAVVRHVVAASKSPLARTIAALVKDDYYDSAGMSGPRELLPVAGAWRASQVSAFELRLIATHLPPCAGRSWRQLVEHAARLDIALEPYDADPQLPAPDQWRREGVRKYFLSKPVDPKHVSALPAVGLGALAVGCLVTMVAVVLWVDPWYTAACQLFILAVVTVVASGLCLNWIGKVNEYRAKLEQYYVDYFHKMPKPSDAEMDAWLEADVPAIVAGGARRNRLIERLVELGGDLLVEPQVVVGLSQIPDLRELAKHLAAIGSESRRSVKVPTPKYKVGEDGQLRSDFYHLMVLYLTAQRICVYRCDLDMAERRIRWESQQAFHYRDVISISSSRVRAPKDIEDSIEVLVADGEAPSADGTQEKHVQVFADDQMTLSTVDGGRLSVRLGSSGTSTGDGFKVAWGNQTVQPVVERMVWSRKEADDTARL